LKNRKIRKKDCEKKWADIFIRWTNNTYNFDYRSEISYNEGAEDISAKSKSSFFPALILELSEAVKFEGDKEIKIIFDLDQVVETINKKLEKYGNNPSIINNVILLIQGHLSKSWINDDLKKLKTLYGKCNFKGIYYISCKTTGSEEFVIPIKNAFK